MKLEKSNFRVDSTGWEEMTIGGQRVKINPERDVIELLEGEFSGEQHFRWGAAKRESAKAAKRMPTDAEWDVLIAEDRSPHLAYETLNLGLAGVWIELQPEWSKKKPELSVGDIGQMGMYWSSDEAETRGHAWRRGFAKGQSSATRYASTKSSYLSVRCVDESVDRAWPAPYREYESIEAEIRMEKP